MLGKCLVGLDRKSYYLATKLGRYSDEDFDFSAARVVQSVEESLKRLNVDYIDLMQCHDVEFGQQKQLSFATFPHDFKLRGLSAAGDLVMSGPNYWLLLLWSSSPLLPPRHRRFRHARCRA